MSDINCPYCNAELDIDHDDGQGYKEDEIHQQECSECEKTFVFTTRVYHDYTVDRADCLNGAAHNFKLAKTYPREFSKMRCPDCGEERDIKPEDNIDLSK